MSYSTWQSVDYLPEYKIDPLEARANQNLIEMQGAGCVCRPGERKMYRNHNGEARCEVCRPRGVQNG